MWWKRNSVKGSSEYPELVDRLSYWQNTYRLKKSTAVKPNAKWIELKKMIVDGSCTKDMIHELLGSDSIMMGWMEENNGNAPRLESILEHISKVHIHLDENEPPLFDVQLIWLLYSHVPDTENTILSQIQDLDPSTPKNIPHFKALLWLYGLISEEPTSDTLHSLTEALNNYHGGFELSFFVQQHMNISEVLQPKPHS